MNYIQPQLKKYLFFPQVKAPRYSWNTAVSC